MRKRGILPIPTGPVVRCDVCPSKHWIDAGEAEVFYPETLPVPDGVGMGWNGEHTWLDVENKSNVVYFCPGSLN